MFNQAKNLSTDEEKRKRMERFGNKEAAELVISSSIPAASTTQPAVPKKKQVRCKHFPNCMNSEEDCPFIHPKENCKYFPACTNGEKCIFLHPDIDCKFGVQCTRQNCAYKHPKGKSVVKSINPLNQMNNVMQMMMMMQRENLKQIQM